MAQKWNKPKTELSEIFLSSNKHKLQVCSGTCCGQIRPASWQVDWLDKSQKSGLLPQGMRDNLRNAGSEAGVQVVCIELSLDELMFNRYVRPRVTEAERHQLQTWSTWCCGVTDRNIPGGDRQETQGCREKQDTLGQEVARPGSAQLKHRYFKCLLYLRGSWYHVMMFLPP